jgi:hypothetical protein
METMLCPCRPNVALRLVRRDGNMCWGNIGFMLAIASIHEIFDNVQLACGPHVCESHLTMRPFAQHCLGPAIHFCNRVWQQRCAWGCDRW